jgi:putative transposase
MPWKPSRLTKAQLEERRLEGGRLLQEGTLSQRDIALELGVTESAVSRWASRLEQDGLHALKARSVPGPSPRMDEAGGQRLLDDLRQGPLHWGYPNNQWTLPRIAQVLRRSQGIIYDPDHLSVVMRRLGWSVQKPQKKALERDEAAIRTWVETTYREVEKGGSSEGPPSSSRTRPAPR